MAKETKLKILWSVLFAVFAAAAIAFLALGIYAGVQQNRSSDFAVNTQGMQVSSVYENDGFYAVGEYNGTVRLYSEENTDAPLFTYTVQDNGETVGIIDVAVTDGKLYVAGSNRYVYIFSCDASENKTYDVKCRVGLVPERMYFSQQSEYFAVYGVNANNRGLYFLPKEGRAAYVCCIEQQSPIDGVTVSGDTVYYSSGQTVLRAQIDSSGRRLTGEEVYFADYGLLGLAQTESGFSAIDTEGTVYSFDKDFTFIGKKDNKTGALSIAFVADDTFVCKIKNGGIVGVDGSGITFSIPSGNESLIVYGSAESFAYLTSDGGAFKYYTLEMARKVQLQKKLFVPFIILAVIMLLAAAYALTSVFEASRTKVNGAFAKFGKTLYKHKFAYISLIPTFTLLAVFYWYPIVSSLFMSLFDYLPGERLVFVGFENFRMVFLNTEFWVSFKNTLIFLVTDLLKALLPPILFAEFLLALRSKRTSYVIRVLLFIPGILPGVASMLVWADGIFGSSSSGLLNGFLSAIVPSWVNKAWLMNDKTALTSLIFMNFPWVGSYLIFFGAISGVDKEIYEASKLDGCGWLRRVLKIDVPLIIPQIKYVFIQTFIGSVQNYTLILITTGGDYGTNTPALMMYFSTVMQKNYGVASAMGVILLLFLMVATIINFKMQIGEGGKKRKHAEA